MTNLELRRRIMSLTLDELARTLGRGFSAGALSLMESGRLKPSSAQARRLRDVLGAPVTELLKPVALLETDSGAGQTQC